MLVISALVGVFDGLGLTMFIPMFESVAKGVSNAQLGKLSFLSNFFQILGLEINLYTALLIMLFFFILKGISKYMQGYLTAKYQEYFTHKIRSASINALSNYKFEAFVTSDAGTIQNTLSVEVQRLVIAFVKYNRMLQNAMLLLAYLLMAFFANPEFAALVALGGLGTNIFFSKMYRKTKQYSLELVNANNSFQGLLIQMVAFFKYLKSTSSIYTYKKYLLARARIIEKMQFRIGFLEALATGIREPVIIAVVVSVILFSINVMGEPLGAILLSLVLFYRALTSVMSMQSEYNNFLALSGSLNQIDHFISELKDNAGIHGSIKFNGFKNSIEIRSLSFSYSSRSILNQISLKIKKNETIAIIGESGSGKTTLINVLSGILKPTEGSVLVDGENLSSFDLKSYQSKIGYITQEPIIFDDDIFNNVTFWGGRNDENITRCWKALEKANISNFVSQMPAQLDSRLGNNGINLSGGQRQRISIARELYKDVEILLMDEATSSLDSETEKTIQSNIDQLKGMYTIIIVAHRLSTIKNVDRVVLMSNGKIEQVGNYEYLLESSPVFERIVKAHQN
ncbi:MAG: ABC transporter ATP-binding protein/permease [Flavobacteriales bacterium]|nr:ABC transporter ATP-binding protein/permease [Flavobacteriales bacterium]